MQRFQLLRQNSSRNLITGLCYQVVSTFLGLLLPHLFITSLGSETNGLLNSIGQVFTCLGLLEAGVGIATIQALYKPIANNAQERINGVLSATNRYYQKTGLCYIVSVALLAITFPFLVDSKLSNSTIRWVILLQGTGAVINYLVLAKYVLLLKAEGKNYVITSIMFFMLLLRNVGKIVAIRLGYDVIAVQGIQLSSVMIESVCILIYIKRHYPWISLKEEPDFESISQKNSVLIQSVAWMVFNHTDILILTLFTRNLGLISVYSVYLLLFEVGQNVMNAIRESFQYRIGKAATQTDGGLDSFFGSYSVIILFATFAVYTTIYCIATPFIRLYTAGVTDVEYLAKAIPEMFFTYKLLYGIRALSRQPIEAAGHFNKTKKISIIEAILNLGVSVMLVRLWDIIGVLAGTIVSLAISDVLYLRYVKRNLAPLSIKKQLKLLGLYIPVVVVVQILHKRIDMQMKSWGMLILYAIVIGIVALTVYSFPLLYSRIRNRK